MWPVHAQQAPTAMSQGLSTTTIVLSVTQATTALPSLAVSPRACAGEATTVQAEPNTRNNTTLNQVSELSGGGGGGGGVF